MSGSGRMRRCGRLTRIPSLSGPTHARFARPLPMLTFRGSAGLVATLPLSIMYIISNIFPVPDQGCVPRHKAHAQACAGGQTPIFVAL